MKVYKMEIMFIDFDHLGKEEAVSLIENARLPNHIIPPDVMDVEEADIGEWRDDHPLNFKHTKVQEYERLFGIVRIGG